MFVVFPPRPTTNLNNPTIIIEELNIISNPIICYKDLQTISSFFTHKDPIKEFIKPLSYSCPICIIETDSHRSKRYDSLSKLKVHIGKCHQNYSHSSGLTYEIIFDLIHSAEIIVFLRLIS